MSIKKIDKNELRGYEGKEGLILAIRFTPFVNFATSQYYITATKSSELSATLEI